MTKIIKNNYNVDNKLNKKILLISDIHYYNKNNIDSLNKVLEKIQNENPDYICITGDIMDEAIVSDIELLISWLKKLAKISKVIMCLGNHDIMICKTKVYFYNQKVFNEIKKINNLYLLEKEQFIDNDICFTGLSLTFDYYYKHNEGELAFIKIYNHQIKKLDSSKYHVLLVHSPIAITKNEVIKKLNNKVDLVLCGHTHGGLTPICLQRILKTRVLISPNKHNFFSKYSYGNFKLENINFVVTSGITKLSHKSRISNLNVLFNPEIVIIKI